MNDEKIWLETEDGSKLFIIKSEKIDMQEELNKTIETLHQELQRKDNIINELKQNKRDYKRENILEMKLHILDNNWNELKEWLDKRSELTNMGIVLDKIKELENDL